MARVELYTIPGRCPLCDETRDLLRRLGIEYDEIDIRNDEETFRVYQYEIPVVRVDGVKHFAGRVDPERLAKLMGIARNGS